MLVDLLLAVACIANFVCFIIHLAFHHKVSKHDFHPSAEDLRRASRLHDWSLLSDDVADRFQENCRKFFTTD